MTDYIETQLPGYMAETDSRLSTSCTRATLQGGCVSFLVWSPPQASVKFCSWDEEVDGRRIFCSSTLPP